MCAFIGRLPMRATRIHELAFHARELAPAACKLRLELGNSRRERLFALTRAAELVGHGDRLLEALLRDLARIELVPIQPFLCQQRALVIAIKRLLAIVE